MLDLLPPLSSSNRFFCLSALIWARYDGGKIGYARREAELASLRSEFHIDPVIAASRILVKQQAQPCKAALAAWRASDKREVVM